MGRDDREVVVVDRSDGGALKWLVMGAALGAGLALLFAPKAGKDLRRDLKKGIRRARELADETLHEFRRETEGDTTEERAVPAGAYVDEEDEDGEDEEPATAERPPRPSLVSAREELERRLAAARARRQAVAPDEEEPVA